jgi:hypothetical protein
MQRVPLVDVCLMTKSLGVANISSFLAAAPDPPEPAAVEKAIVELQALGALTPEQELTSLGRLLALLPGRWWSWESRWWCVDVVCTIFPAPTRALCAAGCSIWLSSTS